MQSLFLETTSILLETHSIQCHTLLQYNSCRYLIWSSFLEQGTNIVRFLHWPMQFVCLSHSTLLIFFTCLCLFCTSTEPSNKMCWMLWVLSILLSYSLELAMLHLCSLWLLLKEQPSIEKKLPECIPLCRMHLLRWQKLFTLSNHN